MLRGASSSSSSKPNRIAQASSSGTQGVESNPALKRTNSLPTHLPSHPRQSTEVKPVREPITRPAPDLEPPFDFQTVDIQGDSKKLRCAALKAVGLEFALKNHFMKKWLLPRINSDPHLMECLTSMHPKLKHYTLKNKLKAYSDLASTHPALRAEIAAKRNALYKIPSYATSTRLMKPMEQKFLSAAMRSIREDVAEKPFHRHGESGVTGNRNGEVVKFTHNPHGSVQLTTDGGDKYLLHNHRPFGEPFTSSASEADHKKAARSYRIPNTKTKSYVTNGKDILHIQPDSMELVKLLPDPKVEEALGKFHEAFRLPAPQQPPHPFSNHEAPAAFKEGWAPPLGWKPPEDYPRDVSFEAQHPLPQAGPVAE